MNEESKTLSELSALVSDICDRAELYTGSTRYQLENLLVNSKPTVFGQYRQACIELSTRVDDLKQRQCQLEALNAETRQVIDGEEAALRKNLDAQQLTEMNRIDAQRRAIERAMAATRREIEILIEIARDRKAKLDPLETWEQHQPRLYLETLFVEAWADFSSSGTVSPAILKGARALSPALREEFLERVKQLMQTPRASETLLLEKDMHELAPPSDLDSRTDER